MEGTLWSGSLFSFTSPLDAIMDKDDFKIEELLAEDELLQELKSNNTRLINKLSEEDSVEVIVRYMSEPAPAGADDLRLHKYPYMACEVLCCEVDSIIDAVVERKDGAMLDQLFSVVTSPTPASDRLAGYFEKVLNVVFRRKSVAVMAFLDRKGVGLFKDFCRQLHNYSVMQSLRVLLLPAVQLAREESGVFMDEVDDALEAGEDGLTVPALQCGWHRDEALLDHLLALLTANTGVAAPGDAAGSSADARAHASELLISVVDLSGCGSLFHTVLTSAKTLKALAGCAVPLHAASPETALSSAPTTALDGDVEQAGAMVACLSVLEVAVVQFCNEAAVELAQQAALLKQLEEGEGGGGEGEAPTVDAATVSDAAAATRAVDEKTDAASPSSSLSPEATLPSTAVPADAAEVLCALVPRVAAYLRSHSTDTRVVNTQRKQQVPRLGAARLKLANLCEALLRLRHQGVEQALVENGVLGLLLDLFFKYEWHSLLHQSVMASVMLVVEGKEEEAAAATAAPLATASAAAAVLGTGPTDPIGGGGLGSTEKREGSGEAAAATLGSALQRHLIVDAKLLERVMKSLTEQVAREKDAAKNNKEEAGGGGGAGNDDGSCKKAREVVQRPGHFGHAVVMCESVMKGIVAGGFMADLVSSSASGPQWHAFMLGTLSEITAVQCRPIGGYAYPNRNEQGMMVPLSSGSQGGGFGGSSNNDDDVKLNDESLAEQMSRLGLSAGGGGMGYGGGDDDDDSDDEEENAIAAAALAAAYGLGSGLGRQRPSGGGDNGDDDSGGGRVGVGDEDSDDEEEEAALAIALAKAYGIGRGGGTGLGMRPEKEEEEAGGGGGVFGSSQQQRGNGVGASAQDDPFGGSGGGACLGGFADFDAFPSSAPASSPSIPTPPVGASFSPLAAVANPLPNGGANGEQPAEANDFANWGDYSSPASNASNPSGTGGTFADFADFGGGTTATTTAAAVCPSPFAASPNVAEAGSPPPADLSPASPSEALKASSGGQGFEASPTPPPAAAAADAPGVGVYAAAAAVFAPPAEHISGGNPPMFQASFEANLSEAAKEPPADPFAGASPFVANFDEALSPAPTQGGQGHNGTASPPSDPFLGFDAFSTAPASARQQPPQQAPTQLKGLGGIDAFASFK